MEQTVSFGYWLRRRRKTLDLTQAELAERAQCVVTTIKKLETGARRPSRRLAERLADALALSSEERDSMLAALDTAAAALLPPIVPAASTADGPRIASSHALSTRLPALPAPPGSLIGRTRELQEVRALLLQRETRLLTLTGLGGAGKTRVALQIAEDLQDAFADGAWFVDLSTLIDPQLVPATLARALGYEAATPLPALAEALREQQALILLDNFEQIVDAASVVVRLLERAPALKVLVTSRSPLRLRYEQEYPIGPLELPPEREEQALDTYAAVKLFVQRAKTVQPEFVLNEKNVPVVAAICRRLDGLPLAIELAAAQVRLLSLPALLQRIEQGLPQLTGVRDLPPRQQTLAATLEWSCRLLGAEARRIFAWLGVFAGGATLAAIEEVCRAVAHTEVLAEVMSLLEHSLLRRAAGPAGEPRIAMLQTVRNYALQQLSAGGDEEIARAQHAAYYLAQAEAAAPQLRGRQQVRWLDALEADHDNLRAADEWFHDQGRSGEELRLAAALHWFWDRRGYLDEGRMRIRRALQAEEGAQDSVARAWALIGAATLAFDQGDREAVAAAAEESVMLFARLGDDKGLTLALLRLAFAVRVADPQRAHELLTAALAHAQAANDPWFVGTARFVAAQAALFGAGDAAAARSHMTAALPALEASDDPYLLAHGYGTLGLITLSEGDFAAARAVLEQGLAQAREVRDMRSIALLGATTADAARCQGDYERAAELYSESLALYQEMGNRSEIPALLHNQGYVALGQGNHPAARALFAESLRRQQAASNQAGIVEGLNGLAALATARGQLERAARLFGAAEVLSVANPAPIWPAERFELDRCQASLRKRLPPAHLAQMWQEGRTYALENALAYALADGERPSAGQRAASGLLSAREREVAALIAQGASNRAIAEALVISERTVERHVANIFAKLNFGSRTQIAAFAVAEGLK